MNTSDAMKITSALTEFKCLTNNSNGQSIIIKIFEDYFRCLKIIGDAQNKKLVFRHVSNILDNDPEFIKLFIDIQNAIVEIKKLDEFFKEIK
jgi:hypothetical protein